MKSSLLKAHLNAAKGYAELSHAERLKVGAILVQDGRPVADGWNGMPSGGSNECEYWIEGIREKQTKPEVVHAEANIIAFAARHGTPTNNATLITTDSPCFECAKLIIQAGIKKVYYERAYRDLSPLYFLQQYEVVVEKLEF